MAGCSALLFDARAHMFLNRCSTAIETRFDQPTTRAQITPGPSEAVTGEAVAVRLRSAWQAVQRCSLTRTRTREGNEDHNDDDDKDEDEDEDEDDQEDEDEDVARTFDQDLRAGPPQTQRHSRDVPLLPTELRQGLRHAHLGKVLPHHPVVVARCEE
jgi:hypothetical protein